MAKHFTKREIDEIEQALIERSKKDTSFPEAESLSGEELIPIVQNGENRRTTYSALEGKVTEEAREYVDSQLDTKVDKVSGKGLSTEDYTTEEKQKLAGIEAGAEVNVNADWDASSGDAVILNKPDLSIYATKASVEDIEALIPSQASSLNQLADKDFVNSTVSTNTADFKGTFNSVGDLDPITANNNDYAFVVSTDAAGNTVYNRYKYTESTHSWLFEYALNNSSFTAAQWAAIQSGITSSLVTKLSALPTATELNNSLNNKVDKVSGKGLSTNDYTTTEKNKLAGIAEGAQVNVLEGVQIDGTDLPIADKKVNLPECIETTKYQTKTDDEFVYRQTGGGLDIDANNARIGSIKGKTLAWNQFIQNGNFENGTTMWTANSVYGTMSAQNGVCTYSVITPYESVLMYQTLNGVIAGHKYLLSLSVKYNSHVPTETGRNAPAFGFGGSYIYEENFVLGVYKTIKGIFTTTNGSALSLNFYFRTQSNGEEGDTIDIKDVFAIDLTLMYGAGNEPTTVEEFEAMFPEEYYPYNAGTLISNDASALETVGFNQWDEEWRNGYFDNSGGFISSPQYIASANPISVLPNADYYVACLGSATGYIDTLYCYDGNMNYLGESQRNADRSNKTLPGTKYVHFRSPANYHQGESPKAYNHDICINLSDASKNGTYEPYWKRIIQLDLTTKKDTDGNVPFADGMKGDGWTHVDECDKDGGRILIRKVVFDGTENWAYSSVVDVFYCEVLILPLLTNTYNRGYGLSNKFGINIPSNGYPGPNTWDITSSRISFNRSIVPALAESTNVQDWKDWLAAQYAAGTPLELVYAIATPVSFTWAEPIPNSILVDELGTEQAIFPTHEDGSPSAPFRADIEYREANVTPDDVNGLTELIQLVNSLVSRVEALEEKNEQLTEQIEQLTNANNGE